LKIQKDYYLAYRSIEMEEFDLVVIGGGPGGYVAAIRAAQLGMKVACVEKRERLGGTCLNVGCIPSKALLKSSELFHLMHHVADHGISTSEVKIDVSKMMDRKDKIINDLGKGIDMLFAKNKVKKFVGEGSFLSANTLLVKGKEQQEIKFKNAIIATGSDVMSIPGIDIDEEKIISSTGALALKQVPKKMIVIGGGYIGLEMGSVWSRLGSEVTVVEYLDRIVPAMDTEVGKNFMKVLESQGLKFKLSTKVKSVKTTAAGVEIVTEPANGGAEEKITTDVVLVSIGRKAFTSGLDLDKAGVTLDDRGRVQINNKFQTNIANIYAIGDVVAGPMLAHKAEEEGVAAVEIIAGQHGHVNYHCIPGVVYTDPEVATVGYTEEQVKELGIEYSVGKFPFQANSRARAVSNTTGFVKIIARKDNDEVLGVHIIGPEAGNLIAEAVLAMEYKASSEDIARICHAHPTLSEALKEAALDVDKRAIHK
jgi:dihydrolipoamide dehydrogenase